MALDGGSGDKQIGHDNSASQLHLDDKAKFADRQGDYILIPKSGEFAFKNDFSAIRPEEAPFFICGGIPEVRVDGIAPEAWDASGTMASFSAGSEVASLRDYKRKLGARRRGPDGEADTVDLADGDKLPPPAPPFSVLLRDLTLQKVEWSAYRASLLAVRNATQTVKRWGCGEEGRGQWKDVPVSHKTMPVEGEELAELLDSASGCLNYTVAKSGKPEDVLQRMGGTDWEKKNLMVRYDLRRFTVNSHPALARAMAKLMAEGKKGEVMKMMEDSLPRIIRKFEHETGRQVIGASIHWDADLPHWNLWHSGLERVLYKKEGGKGKPRIRYRRTAMNLGSSGPGLRAWRRTQLAFERLGKAFCPFTAEQLRKEERKKLESQGRTPGDWSINAAADAVLEEMLTDGGFKQQVTEGFEEFVANEENRYGAGMAGRLAREDREGLAKEIRKLQELSDERGDLATELKAAAEIAGQQARAEREGLAKEIRNLKELAGEREAELTKFKSDAPVNSKIRQLVADFLAMVAEKPHVVALLKRVPLLRELFSSLASLVGVELDLGPVEHADALKPVTVELGRAKAAVESVAQVEKPAFAPPEIVVDPIIGVRSGRVAGSLSKAGQPEKPTPGEDLKNQPLLK
jgi:hypothetical protein